MAPLHIETQALDEQSRTAIDADLSLFVAQWKASPFARMNLDPDGLGSAADIRALDYAIYEGIYEHATLPGKTFIATSAVVFGNCLRNLQGFEWCWAHLSNGPVLGVKHPYNGLTIPLEAIIASHLTGIPQYENFEYLFCKLLGSANIWPTGFHFLEDLFLLVDPGEFEEQWKFTVPESIKQRYVDLSAIDEMLLVHELGMLPYDWKDAPDWDAIEQRLLQTEFHYLSRYGKDWKARLL